MTSAAGLFELISIIVVAAAAIFIALNWLSLIAFIVTRQQGNFSFAPPFLCGILGAVFSMGAFDTHTAWIAACFVLFDPSIGLTLSAIAIKKLRR